MSLFHSPASRLAIRHLLSVKDADADDGDAAVDGDGNGDGDDDGDDDDGVDDDDDDDGSENDSALSLTDQTWVAGTCFLFLFVILKLSVLSTPPFFLKAIALR